MLERISEKLNKAGVDKSLYFIVYHMFWYTLLTLSLIYFGLIKTLGVIFLGLIYLAYTQG
jgi:hypothetical protein